MKIYTRVGDKGGTSLYDGSKVNKDDVIIDCIGNIDELNSEIGCIISHLSTIEERGDLDTYIQILTNIQSELFDMGALIAYPKNPESKQLDFDIDGMFTKSLETAIDDMTAKLPKLVNFILPGGSIQMSMVHRGRTICRRAERSMVCLKTNDIEIQDTCYMYMNRLSDFLFTLARYVGMTQNVSEVIYKKIR
jgi:cob(I)alamin adenosyltransferase